MVGRASAPLPSDIKAQGRKRSRQGRDVQAGLASLGINSGIAYGTRQRTQEIGIRMAPLGSGYDPSTARAASRIVPASAAACRASSSVGSWPSG